jgi:hypothetical protein
VKQKKKGGGNSREISRRTTLGVRDFASGHFDLRTLHNFRHRLGAQMRTVSSRQPGHPKVIAGVRTEGLDGLDPRWADL